MKNSILFGLSTIAALLFFVPDGQAQQKPIIGVAGISHESNSFSSQPTKLEDFAFSPGVSAEERAKQFFSLANSQTTSSGYIEGAKRFNLELYPALLTRARPMGPVTDQAFETLTGEMIAQLKSGPKLDGILLSLHGAMVAENYPSGDEEIVKRVRKAFGPKMPIIVTHDFHANITPKIVEYADVLITFKENPH
ncbi:MAG TPA: M81 family metallopeptidase, partial [Cyclobacteriaceae bacterium]|nr:M81 family metallopeptidase [Cyclobacteriaceae bacterium]